MDNFARNNIKQSTSNKISISLALHEKTRKQNINMQQKKVDKKIYA